MGFIKRVKEWKPSFNNGDAGSEKPIVIEALEPRILLSADTLLRAALTDPDRDLLQNDDGLVYQHADLLETHAEQDEETDSIQPLFTLSLDETVHTTMEDQVTISNPDFPILD
ncbi:MAG TPA: LEPR-XLL domain-containing protein, partial [Candidatus Avalokitesvara rifleensis]|uniref:LEPR-XLL domain-containing protein n=1 Tax=Candidatus Avalokitesvara rifleensis TaxID=3367620 RepID=UPI004024FD57